MRHQHEAGANGAATSTNPKTLRHSRAELLLRAGAIAGALAVGGAVAALRPGFASSAPSPEQDVQILNLVLQLEELEAGFFVEARDGGFLDGELLEFARTVAEHEQAHVAFLREALGDSAAPPPELDFGDATSDPDRFVAEAIGLEDLMVAAYNGQAPNLTPTALEAAARIVSVEARHAAWIRAIAGERPAPSPTDRPKSAEGVQAAVAQSGFVQEE